MGCLKSTPKKVEDPHVITHAAVNGRHQGFGCHDPACHTAARIHYTHIEEDYTMDVKVVGSGYSGPVRLATSVVTGKQFAIKSFNKRGLHGKKLQFLKNEVLIYLLLDHPNVARLHDVYEDEHEVHLVMEYCSGKELYHRLVSRHVFSERDAVDSTYQMLLAIQYLHSHNVVHRDIKLENFLYEDESEDAKLKLIDFGFSKLWDKNTCMHQSCGSVAYVAPEVLSGSYTDKCDMWSLGVIVFMLLSGQPPFYGSEEKMLLRIEKGVFHMKPERWSSVSAHAKDFVRQLLVVDPAKRLSAQDALKHDWITSRAHAPGEDLVTNDVLESLRQFALGSHFKRAALTMMAYSLTSDEIHDIHDVFVAMDSDHDGKIKLSEMAEIMKDRLEIDNEEMNRVLGVLDQSHDGEIEYSEFLAAMLSTRIRLHEGMVRQTFHNFDRNGSGKISLDDLRSVFGNTFEGDDVAVLIKEADKTGDGFVDYEEFLEALHRSPSPKVSTAKLITSSGRHTPLAKTASMVDRAIAGSPSKLLRSRQMSRLRNSSAMSDAASSSFLPSPVHSPREITLMVDEPKSLNRFELENTLLDDPPFRKQSNHHEKIERKSQAA